ncbi:MAG TPA: hypothetical protein VJP82_01245 [Sphingomicrobium sp.]|jgi:hypothetical protein|nr:hypothetical protein [Sphingomicrobium sp.]
MPRNSNRSGRKNNNPSGRNQYSDWGVMEMARERPIAAAAAAAGAAAAGLFLWSKRTAISDQLSNLSDQFSEWREGMNSNGEFDDTAGLTTTASTGRGMSETGGGNASLGRQSGGSGMSTTASGRGRAKSRPTT